MSEIKFESEELETNWNIYVTNFRKRFIEKEGSLARFKIFINKEPNKEEVLKRICTSVLKTDINITLRKIQRMLEYIEYDFVKKFSKYVSETQKYRENYKEDSNDEIIYNKLVLLRCMQDGQNYLKIFIRFYNYYIYDAKRIYKICYGKDPENNEELLEKFITLYEKTDINFIIYHDDYYTGIVNILKYGLNKIIPAIYNDQAGCCVATPTFNILDLLIETFRNLNRILV